MATVPTFDKLMNPTIKSLQLLGGSAHIDEIYAKVIEIMKLSSDLISVLHKPNSNQTEIEYRLAWARTYLKSYGVLEKSTRGVWTLTLEGKKLNEINPDEVKKHVRGLHRQSADSTIQQTVEEVVNAEIVLEEDWKDKLILTVQEMHPSAFEKLIQRMLRESGFIQVDVTGRTGDGGIDGKGIIRIGGLMSFHIIFQCKRYKGSVSSGEIRDFRGAMQGRADKGLFVTTGRFTPDAMREATRDGAPPIDLMDGNLLAEKLRDLKLGVYVEMIEKVTIVPEFFQAM